MHIRQAPDGRIAVLFSPRDLDYARLSKALRTGTLIESKDASGHEHKDKGPGGGQFTGAKHGERAAKAHTEYHALMAQAHKARADAYAEVKKDADSAKQKATETADAAWNSIGEMVSDTNDEGRYEAIEANIRSLAYDLMTPAEEFGLWKEVEGQAKEMLTLAHAWTPSNDPTDDDLTQENVEENKTHLQAITKHAKEARQQLKLYVKHRQELKAIKANEPMDVQESMRFDDLDDAGLVELMETEVAESLTNLREDKTAHKPAGSPEGGQFTSGNAGGSHQHEPTPGPSAAGKVKDAATAVHHYLHDKGAQGFAKLPKPVQSVVSTALKVAFAGWSASQAIAERISKEKGSTDEEAAQTRSTLAAWDLIGFKPLAIATAPLGPVVGDATWIVPPATGVYLAHAAVMHPMATYRAAKGIVKDALEAGNKLVKDHTQTMESEEQKQDPHQFLADALEKQKYSPWFSAILHAAIEETQDAGEAVKIAERSFEAHPEDKSELQDDDAESLFTEDQ